MWGLPSQSSHLVTSALFHLPASAPVPRTHSLFLLFSPSTHSLSAHHPDHPLTIPNPPLLPPPLLPGTTSPSTRLPWLFLGLLWPLVPPRSSPCTTRQMTSQALPHLVSQPPQEVGAVTSILQKRKLKAHEDSEPSADLSWAPILLPPLALLSFRHCTSPPPPVAHLSFCAPSWGSARDGATTWKWDQCWLLRSGDVAS